MCSQLLWDKQLQHGLCLPSPLSAVFRCVSQPFQPMALAAYSNVFLMFFPPLRNESGNLSSARRASCELCDYSIHMALPCLAPKSHSGPVKSAVVDEAFPEEISPPKLELNESQLLNWNPRYGHA